MIQKDIINVQNRKEATTSRIEKFLKLMHGDTAVDSPLNDTIKVVPPDPFIVNLTKALLSLTDQFRFALLAEMVFPEMETLVCWNSEQNVVSLVYKVDGILFDTQKILTQKEFNNKYTLNNEDMQLLNDPDLDLDTLAGPRVNYVLQCISCMLMEGALPEDLDPNMSIRYSYFDILNKIKASTPNAIETAKFEADRLWKGEHKYTATLVLDCRVGLERIQIDRQP